MNVVVSCMQARKKRPNPYPLPSEPVRRVS